MRKATMACRLLWTTFDTVPEIRIFGSFAGDRGRKRYYQKLEKEPFDPYNRLIDPELRRRHPEFAEAYDAIFGDPLQIPSYGYFMRLVQIGRVFDDPATWDKLPDSFEAIYQLSLNPDLEDFSETDQNFKLSIKEAVALRQQQENEERIREQEAKRPAMLKAIEAGIRRFVMNKLIEDYLANMSEELKLEIETKVADTMKSFCDAHPDLEQLRGEATDAIFIARERIEIEKAIHSAINGITFKNVFKPRT